MKRVFSVIISLFTVYIPKKLGYERIRKDPPLQEAAQSEKEIFGEGAKDLGSGENVQKMTTPYPFLKKKYQTGWRLRNPLSVVVEFLSNRLTYSNARLACYSLGLFLGYLFGIGLYLLLKKKGLL